MRILLSVSFVLLLVCGMTASQVSAQHCAYGSSSYQSYLRSCPAHSHYDHGAMAEMPMASSPVLAEAVNDMSSSETDDSPEAKQMTSSPKKPAASTTVKPESKAVTVTDGESPPKKDKVSKGDDLSTRVTWQVAQQHIEESVTRANRSSRPTKRIPDAVKSASVARSAALPKTSP